MAIWQPELTLSDSDGGTPIFIRIAQRISDDIARGRLRAGQQLPGSREVAGSLGVHRNTVVAAFDELKSQGWLETRRARGTFVADVDALAAHRGLAKALPRVTMPERPRYDLDGPDDFAVSPERRYVLSGGRPDARLFPRAMLARAYRRVLARRGPELLDYGDPYGHRLLRRELALMLSNLRGLAASEEHILVTRGAQMALALVFRALVQPGDVVAVEDYGYPPAWAAMRASGARLVPIPVDEHGMQVRALERLTEHERVRAIYVTPHHQWPTMAVLHPARRKRLLEIAERARIAVVEDDYDHEYHYEGRPVLPLASTDRAGTVVYVGTLSKVLAPGLRLGYVVAPRPVVARLAEMRFALDRQGDAVTECAVAELLEEGEVQRHMWRTRRIYASRRDALVAELRAELGDVLQVRAPTGGLALWARVRDGIDVDAWAKAAAAEDVTFLPGSACTFDGSARPFARFGYARLDGPEMREAVRRLRRAADSIAASR